MHVSVIHSFKRHLSSFRFHGCLKCYNPEARVNFLNKTIGELNDATIRRQRAVASKVSSVVVMWECELKAKMHAERELKERLDSYTVRNFVMERDKVRLCSGLWSSAY